MHPELVKAIQNKDYEKICNFLCTSCFSSDSDHTVQIKRQAWIDGWKDFERLRESI